MTDFFNNLASPSWWISVFVVGILLSIVGGIAANYLKSPIDRCLSSISTKYQTRTKAKKAEREAKIVNLVGNKQEQILHASKTNFALMMSVFCYLGGISFLTMVFVIAFHASKPSLAFDIFFFTSLILAAIMMLGGLSYWGEAIDSQWILKEARDRESKVQGNN